MTDDSLLPYDEIDEDDESERRGYIHHRDEEYDELKVVRCVRCNRPLIDDLPEGSECFYCTREGR